MLVQSLLDGSPSLWGSLIPLTGTILLFCALHYVFLEVEMRSQRWKKWSQWKPPMLPYLIPFWGSTFNFILRPAAFMMETGKHLGTYMPVRVRLLFGNVYIIRGKENVASLWKESVNSNYTQLLGFMLDRMFDMPSEALSLWEDDSGFLNKPHPNSATPAHNRVDHMLHSIANEFLMSSRSGEIAQRFSNLLQTKIASLTIESNWTEMGDMMEFFEFQMTAANIEAMYGPTIQSQNPTLCEDFWLFNHNLGAFCKQFPKWTVNWTIPAACKARARILSSIKGWQTHIRMMSEVTSLENLDSIYDVYWKPSLVHKWQQKLRGMDGFSDDAIASLYFGIIWVSNVNIIPTVFWMCLELYRDPVLLAEARAAVERCTPDSSSTTENSTSTWISNLTKEPILQSIFAETLRLRTHAYITRYFSHKSITLGKQWVIPQNKICLLSTQPAHHDEQVWNDYDGSFPLDTFWAQRFLVNPQDPLSGPIKPTASTPDSPTTRQFKADRFENEPRSEHGHVFSTEGLNGAYIPFGGGPRACPGRRVAKQQCLATLALIITQFDIEILANEDAWAMDEKGYGPGVQRPVGKIPFRIRRREN